MTERTPPAPPPAPAREERLITFRGREIAVRFPTDGQLLVWQRSVQDIERSDSAAWDGEEAMRAMGRAGRIIDSVIVSRSDREWIDDLTLDEGLSLADRAEIIQLTLEAFTDKTDGKTPAKKAAPAKRARRKAS